MTLAGQSVELVLKFSLVMGLGLFLVMTALGLFSFIRSFVERDVADSVFLTKDNPLLRATVKALNWVVGKSWRDFGISIRLVAFYWIAIPTLGSLVFVADPNWQVHDSTLIAASWHVLIWANIFTDFVSLNVTRNCILEFTKSGNTSLLRSLKLIMKDLGVATSMLILAWIGGNVAFLLLTSLSWEAAARDFFFTVFNPNTLTNTFAVRSGPQGADPATGLPWMVILTVTTYLPTFGWVAVGILSVFIAGISSFFRKFFQLTYEDVSLLGYLTLCGAGFMGFLYCLNELHKLSTVTMP